jgi:hypothetical protein
MQKALLLTQEVHTPDIQHHDVVRLGIDEDLTHLHMLCRALGLCTPHCVLQHACRGHAAITQGPAHLLARDDMLEAGLLHLCLCIPLLPAAGCRHASQDTE